MGHLRIRVEGLKKRLGINQALNNVSLEFSASELHGVIGPEGSGKTTLLRMMIGLLHADEGKVTYFDGESEIGFDKLRPDISYMPQTQSLYPDLSISEHLDFFRGLYDLSDTDYAARRKRLLSVTRLGPFVDRSAAKLSGGMYKKLGLMCSLLHSPRLLLLDEPTTGVDPISRREFWDLLYQLKEQGILILITTAYMDEAERCGQVHLLDRGQVMAEGEPRALLEREGVSNFDDFYLKREDRLA